MRQKVPSLKISALGNGMMLAGEARDSLHLASWQRCQDALPQLVWQCQGGESLLSILLERVKHCLCLHDRQ